MASSWVDAGVGFCTAIDGGPFTEDGRSATFSSGSPFFVDVRVGRSKTLKPLKGLVVRGVDAKLRLYGANEGEMFSMSMPAAVLYGTSAQALTAPGVRGSDGQSAAGKYVEWVWDIADSTIPLAILDSEADVPGSRSWGGITIETMRFNQFASSDYKNRLEIRTASTLAKYLVSAKPGWTITAPGTLGAGATGQLSLRVAYPDGEPVIGLQVQFSSTTQAVAFAGGALSARAATDGNGVITLPITSVRSGADSIKVVVVDPRTRTVCFDPPLDTNVAVNASYINVDGRQCVLVPADPGVPTIPSRTVADPTYAWDSGANSTKTLEGDVYTEFSGAEAILGGVVGFTTEPDRVPDPTRIAHGWYMHEGVAQVYESGKLLTPPEAYAADTVFRIQRSRGQVTYLLDGDIYRTSPDTLSGVVSVGASLFGEGDFLFEPQDTPAPPDGGEPVAVITSYLSGGGRGTWLSVTEPETEYCSDALRDMVSYELANQSPGEEVPTNIVVVGFAAVNTEEVPGGMDTCTARVPSAHIAAITPMDEPFYVGYSSASIHMRSDQIPGEGWYLFEIKYSDQNDGDLFEYGYFYYSTGW